MKINKLFECRDLWRIYIYQLSSFDDLFELDKFTPLFSFGETGIRRDTSYRSITADPFLLTYHDRMFLFYEVKTDHWHGEIWVDSMGRDMKWISHGRILSDCFHLSYPHVFELDGNIYMIPESANSGYVFLYQADIDSFPEKWIRRSILVKEPLRDPSIFISKEGFYLLCTDINDCLKVYFSNSLTGEFKCCEYIVSADLFSSRNAGKILSHRGKHYRIAQNCSKIYGESISIYEIHEITSDRYSEYLILTSLLKNKKTWCEIGYHHLSIEKYHDFFYVAIDGCCKDRYINTLSLGCLKIIRMITSRYFFNHSDV